METTENYGRITEMVVNTTEYVHRDSDDNEYTFEVYPITISTSEIDSALSRINIGNVWFVSFKTSITPPKDDEIQKALTDGLLIKLYFNAVIIDNYGFVHTIIFDKEQEKYNIVTSPNLLLITEPHSMMPLPNSYIDMLKEADNPLSVINSIQISSRVMHKRIGSQFNSLFREIKSLEDRLKLLEQK
jgi:hypothetical protein